MEAAHEAKTVGRSQYWIATRQSLLSRLKDWRDNDSWKEFFDLYSHLIYQAVLRSGLKQLEANEVVQDTVIEVYNQIPKFKYDRSRGSFKSWLLRVTQRMVFDYRRRQMKAKRFEVNLPHFENEFQQSLNEIPDTISQTIAEFWEAQWEQNLKEAALEKLKLKVEVKHFQIFDAYVLQAWKVSKVAAVFGVRMGEVYLVKHRLKKMLSAEFAAMRSKTFEDFCPKDPKASRLGIL